jgi:dTDP-4-dehydrorhamnose 3,5-epimerase
MIDGSHVLPLTVHPDERGHLFEILRSDDPRFMQFGQVYVTTAHPGVVKAWHCHRLQTDFFCLIHGRARFALYDAREDSPTKGEINEYMCDGEAPQRIIIPAGVYHGFKNEGVHDAICVNCPTETYNCDDPDELRIDPFDNDIPYDWNAKNSGLTTQ